MKRIRWGLAAVLLALAAIAVTGLAGAASAQNQETNGAETVPATVTAVDAGGELVEVSLLRGAYDLSASDIELSEGGTTIESVAVATARDEARPTEIIYVVDVDNRTAVDGGLNELVSAISASVEQLPAEVKVGMVSAGDQATVQTRLTTDRRRVAADLQALTAEQGAALFDAVELAGHAFSDGAGVVRSVIVMSTGPDTASELAGDAVGPSLVQSGAQVIWLSEGQADAALADIVQQSGGAASVPGADASVADIVADATATAVDRLLVTFPGLAEVGDRGDVALTVADQSIRFSYPAGVATRTGLQLQPVEDVEVKSLGFFGQPIVLYLSIAMAFLAISAAIWALGSMYSGGETSLDKVLARYSDRDDTLEEEEVQEMLVQTALIRRAIDMTETFAESRGFLTRVENLLERANLPVRAGEALFFLAALDIVVAGLTFAVTGTVFVAAIVALITAVGGYFVVQFMANRRLKQFEAQLPDALQLLAGTLRAGYSLPQGLDAVSTEIADPMGQELRRAITEAQLGREIEEALAGIAERLDSADFAWSVMAIGIQREVGGNLAELLLTVAETMVQRERLHREVNSLTAEGRVSAGILSLMPPVLGFVMWVMNPAYIEVLFSRTIGLIALGAAGVSALVGLVWMKKVITIDV